MEFKIRGRLPLNGSYGTSDFVTASPIYATAADVDGDRRAYAETLLIKKLRINRRWQSIMPLLAVRYAPGAATGQGETRRGIIRTEQV
jgi:hypothetical protein